MEITIGDQAFLVIDAAHENAGPGWFYVAPHLPEEARSQIQIAPMQVIFHPPTAEYGEQALNDPATSVRQALKMAQDLLKK